MKSKEQLRQVFENGDKPKQEDFWDWQDAYWHKEEEIPKDSVEGLNESFYQQGKETLTVLEQPTLTGNVLTLNYVGENGITQSVNVDLSSLHTVDVNVSGATFNASNNIITLTETDGEAFQIDLSQLQIVATTDSNGTTTISQEGTNKLTISKAGQSGNYADLVGLPDLTAFATLSNLNSKADKSIQINTTSPLQGGGDLSGSKTISIQQANSLQGGYLTNTDWNAFNNKMTTPTLNNNNVGRWSTTSGNFVNGAIQDDADKIGIRTAPDTQASPSPLRIRMLNGKLASFQLENQSSFQILNDNTVGTLNVNDFYIKNQHMWLYANTGSKTNVKFTGLQWDASITGTFNISTYNSWNAIANTADLFVTDNCYGNPLTTQLPNIVGFDSRMYTGFAIKAGNGYSKSILYVDTKGQIFARGSDGTTYLDAETDWKKALTDNQNKTTTLGSETSYTNVKWAVDSTTKAVLPAPRMTEAQRLAITLGTAQEGAIVYQTDGVRGYYLWNGTSWQTLGSNIANADLTNTSARVFTQNAGFTWDTLGNSYYWKGLVDKTGDQNFNKTLALNPTTGEVAIKVTDNLLVDYTHSTNQELTPIAINETNGYITCSNHGLTINSFYNSIAVPNAFKNNDIANLVAGWKAIPYEVASNFSKVKVIDTNTLQICDYNGNPITFSLTSTENTGNLDITKWHLEIASSTNIDIKSIPRYIYNVNVVIDGYANRSNNPIYWKLNLYDSNGSIISNEGATEDTLVTLTRSLLQADMPTKAITKFYQKFSFSVNERVSPIFYEGMDIFRNTGSSVFTSTKRDVTSYSYNAKYLSTKANTGIAGIHNYGLVSTIANGTKIKIFKS